MSEGFLRAQSDNSPLVADFFSKNELFTPAEQRGVKAKWSNLRCFPRLTMMKWTNEIILEFLDLYEKEPAIWDPRHVSHKDRFAIADAWRRIEANMSMPCAVEELKRKKDSLMATFRSLTIKVKASIDNSAGVEDIYRPNWFAYDSMARFLDGIYQPRTYLNKEDTDDTFRIQYNEQDSTSPLIEDIVENDDDSKHSFPETISTFKPPPERRLRKRKEMRPEGSSCNCENHDRDECFLFTQLLATKLRSFDGHTRDVLMHEIDNLVFRTKMQKRRKLDNISSNSNFLTAPDEYNDNPLSFVEDNENYCDLSSQDSPNSGAGSTPTSTSVSNSYQPSRNCVVVKSEM